MFSWKELSGHLVEAGDGSSDEAEDPKSNDEEVFPEDPVETAKARLPANNKLNEWGEHESEGGQADSSNERDEGSNVGDGDRNGNYNQSKIHFTMRPARKQ